VQRAYTLADMRRYTQAIVALKDLINRYPDSNDLFIKKLKEVEKLKQIEDSKDK